ncbi:MAG: hypothetical protein M1267_00955 [Candidatus Thermoplasmatota archaeon]|jgi:hypothetical protein|nr:hypothetical protein [Candidatus Thermoplasmatota archaeon]MCL5800306.1 hypothetical protein [Candidatus Thermoplasmatota archaeon]
MEDQHATSWRRLVFSHPIEKRDQAREKDFSSYLIPAPGETNRFFIESRNGKVDFYLSSTSVECRKLLESYFFLCYDATAQESTPERISGKTIAYVNASRVNLNAKELQEPGFVRFLTYLPYSAAGLMLDYEVIVVSKGTRSRTKYSFALRITMNGNPGLMNAAETAVRMKISELYSSIGMKMKQTRRSVISFRRSLLGTPFKLTSFVGIPTDEGSK